MVFFVDMNYDVRQGRILWGDNVKTNQRHFLGQAHLERGVCESCDRLYPFSKFHESM